jgi:hypothetical protein
MGEHTLELIGTIGVALITALIGPIVIEYVKSKMNKKDLIEDPIKKELEQSCIISDELEDIRELFDADRAWITIIHNGGHFLHTNKSIQKFSVMHEVAKPGVSSIGMIFKNIPVSLFTRAIEQQLKGEVIYIPNVNDSTVSTFGLKSGFESTGTRAAMSKGLFDISTNSLIGTIGVDFLKPKKLTEEQIEVFTNKAERMSGYISNFIKDI